jgi:hypothetical protein
LLKSLPFSRRARKQKSKSVRKTVLKRANVKFAAHSHTTDAQSPRSGQHGGLETQCSIAKKESLTLSVHGWYSQKERLRETYKGIYWSAIFCSGAAAAACFYAAVTGKCCRFIQM